MKDINGPVFVPIVIGLLFLIGFSNRLYSPVMWVVRGIAMLLILLGCYRLIKEAMAHD